ncbi:RepB family plasmid replication initiator protein [Moraxella lacunata]|uniref:Replication initiation protein n=1 Tax=Moraxella lacunata TaxID=477 RepID=A0A1V4GYQ1_MORLA|nr:RepB family plasmid replication initiator protein [Moraxella lacunata]OPH37737.1 replication initiation protein [Moraxella lacunata]
MTDFNLETLDFETLQKVSKSIEMIDEQFGGNPTMKRAILKNYGFSLDDFPTVFEPNPVAKQAQEQAVQLQNESVEKSLELQNKLVYGDKWYVLQNRLLNAITNLDLNERRLIMLLSPIVRKDVEDFPNKNRRVFVVKALDFAETYEIKPNNVYKMLANTADTILGKAFWFWNFKDDKPFGEKTYKTGMTWVSKCNYLEDRGGNSYIFKRRYD